MLFRFVSVTHNVLAIIHSKTMLSNAIKGVWGGDSLGINKSQNINKNKTDCGLIFGHIGS